MLPKAVNYQFSGDPVSQASAAAAHRADRQAQAQIAAATSAAGGQIGAARQGALNTLFAQPGSMYGAFAGANAAGLGSYQDALGGLASAYAGGSGQMANAQSNLYRDYNTGMANLYGAQLGAMGQADAAKMAGLSRIADSAGVAAGGMANAQSGLYQGYNQGLANLYGNQLSALGQTETARLVGLANLGSAALSSGGQAAGNAMGAWGQNQAGFAKAMSDAAAANQMALSQYGVGRDNALSGLGAAASNLGAAQAKAAADASAAAQMGMAQYGSARESALASLGASASSYGSSLNKAWTDAQANANQYSRDINKLGVARDLGIGQLGVGSQMAGNMPAITSGLGSAIGGALGALPGGSQPSASVLRGADYATQPPPSLPSYGYTHTPYEGPGNALYGDLRNASRDTFGSLDGQRGSIVSSPVLAAMQADAAAARGQIGSSDSLKAIASMQRDITGSPVLGSLRDSDAAWRSQIGSAYKDSQRMPSRMLQDSFTGLGSLLRDSSSLLSPSQAFSGVADNAADRMREGVRMGGSALGGLQGNFFGSLGGLSGAMSPSQDYRGAAREGARNMRSALNDGAGAIGGISSAMFSGLGGVGAQMGSGYYDMVNRNDRGYQAANQQLADIMDRTGFMSDLERQRMNMQMQDEMSERVRRQRDDVDRRIRESKYARA